MTSVCGNSGVYADDGHLECLPGCINKNPVSATKIYGVIFADVTAVVLAT